MIQNLPQGATIPRFSRLFPVSSVKSLEPKQGKEIQQEDPIRKDFRECPIIVHLHKETHQGKEESQKGHKFGANLYNILLSDLKEEFTSGKRVTKKFQNGSKKSFSVMVSPLVSYL